MEERLAYCRHDNMRWLSTANRGIIVENILRRGKQDGEEKGLVLGPTGEPSETEAKEPGWSW